MEQSKRRTCEDRNGELERRTGKSSEREIETTSEREIERTSVEVSEQESDFDAYRADLYTSSFVFVYQ